MMTFVKKNIYKKTLFAGGPMRQFHAEQLYADFCGGKHIYKKNYLQRGAHSLAAGRGGP